MMADPQSRAMWRSAMFGLAALSAAALIGGVLSLPRIETAFTSRAQTESTGTLRLAAATMDQALRSYDPLPELIAQQPDFLAALNEPDNDGLIPFLNEKLNYMTRAVGASDIYLMDRSGLTIAASNYRSDASFIGKRFDYRPYFQDALAGRSARFHALGTTSLERGLFFAAPVLDGIEIVGVLAVKVTIDPLEADWAGAGRVILIADGNGILFASSRPDFRLRSLAPLPDGIRERIEQTQQFPLAAVRPLDANASVITPGVVELSIQQGNETERFLSSSQPLEMPGWHAIVLTSLDPVRVQALYALAVWSLAVLALTLGAYIVLLRWGRVQDRIRAEGLHRADLERRVQARTKDLDAANVVLRREIDERKSAEARLRKTETELIQAGKLAALGQMSATLTHEINQPLAAVKSYAENAVQYLDRDRTDEARANVGRISEMADRMARISGHLRSFARRPQETLRPVDVAQVVRDAVDFFEPEARRAGAKFAMDLPKQDIWAVGGSLRLQQVLVNLMKNALDAMAGTPAPQIEIGVEATPGTIEISVRDHGPGLPEAEGSKVFEPFFTTKDTSKGMGLGLSISFKIIEEFGGTLSASNRAGGGADFRIRLRRAAQTGQAVPPLVAE